MTLLVVPCVYDLLNRDKGGEPQVKVKKEKKVRKIIEKIITVDDLDD
jgi:hypothetical protein